MSANFSYLIYFFSSLNGPKKLHIVLYSCLANRIVLYQEHDLSYILFDFLNNEFYRQVELGCFINLMHLRRLLFLQHLKGSLLSMNGKVSRMNSSLP